MAAVPAPPHVVDCAHVEGDTAASFILQGSDESAVVEAGTALGYQLILARLDQLGIARESVSHLFVTHAHLDHAGGAAALLEALPAAKIVLHPLAALHLGRPLQLAFGTELVFGAERYQRLFGSVKAIAGQRMVVAEDGQRFAVCGRVLQTLFTRGHANHHYCLFDAEAQAVFSGDSFGVSYPSMAGPSGRVVLPLTPPTEFDLDEARKTVDRVMALEPRVVYLTHFGALEQPAVAACELRRAFDVIESILARLSRGDWGADREQACFDALHSHALARAASHGVSTSATAWRVLQDDLRINAAGLIAASDGRQARAQEARL
jgi:glyoxylase-like metal-dependent hydrolase (beta-lactamase superfamily II)